MTRAMQMVAAAKLRRAQERAQAARPYAEKIAEVLARVAGTGASHPLFAVRSPARILYVVFTSDRGLAGAYNVNVVKRAAFEIARHPQSTALLLPVGRRGREYFRRRGMTIVAEHVPVGEDARVSMARAIAAQVQKFFEDGVCDQVQLVYTRYLSTSRQQVTVEQLLPVVAPGATAAAGAAASAETGADEAASGEPVGTGELAGAGEHEYIFEPSVEAVLAGLVPAYLEAGVYHALLEAKASEHAARMTAMANATDNAGEMIDELTLEMNSIRQANITREIAEIVGGAEAQNA